MLMQSLVAPKKFVISSSSRYSQSSGMEQDRGTRGHFGLKPSLSFCQSLVLQSSGSLQNTSHPVLYLFLYWFSMEKRTTPSQVVNIAHSIFYKIPPGTLNCIPFQH